ncbi:MAG: hypothetical protein Fur0028_16490 [Bacteroidales bacterium]|jgi:hypothetical protein|nr:hypothetical protein [Flavobacterium piscis]NMC99933.1 hypothetical protein [Bacteroidales bacterium]
MENKQIISNPYKSVGVLHNKGVDFIITKLDPKKFSIENVIDFNSQYLQDVEGNLAKSNYLKWYEFTANQLNGLEQIQFSEILREGKLSKEATFYINEILEISVDFDYETIIKVLSNIEENILYSEMTQFEKQLPLLCVAVAKESVNYWIEQLKNPQSPWKPFYDGPLAKAAWPWRADAKGAVQGAVSGAISGSITGAGALVGAGVGALAGGVSASVGAFLFPEKNK